MKYRKKSKDSVLIFSIPYMYDIIFMILYSRIIKFIRLYMKNNRLFVFKHLKSMIKKIIEESKYAKI